MSAYVNCFMNYCKDPSDILNAKVAGNSNSICFTTEGKISWHVE